MVANVLPIINLPMALGNLPIAANGLQLVRIGNDLQGSCWEKGNFLVINKFKYDQTWNIWPSPLSLSLYNPFSTCLFVYDQISKDMPSNFDDFFTTSENQHSHNQMVEKILLSKLYLS